MNEREKKLIQVLIEQTSYQPASFFAEKIGVSSKTIYKYIETLSYFFVDYDLNVTKVPRRGILLKGSDINKNKLTSVLTEYSQQEELAMQPSYRRLYIFSNFLFLKNVYSYKHYAQKFYVSIQSIKKDVDEIIDYCSRRQLFLKRMNSTLYFEASEQVVQQVFKEYIEEYLENNALSQEQEFEIFGKKTVSIVSEMLKELKIVEPKLPNEYLLNSLRTAILILVGRLVVDNHITPDREFLFEKMKKLQLYMTAIKLVDINKEKSWNLFLQEDIYYLCSLLLAHGIRPILYEGNDNNVLKETIDQMIHQMSEMLEYDLSVDNQLKDSLLSHIEPMIYRLKIGIDIKNPLKNQIINQYSVMYALTSYCVGIIEKKFSLQLTDDEISFLTIHFQVALEKTKVAKHILIVCPTGLGTSQLIFQKIKQVLPARFSLEIVELNKLEKIDLSLIDLLIAAVHLPDINIPTVYVSPLPTSSEIILINEKLSYIDNEDRTFSLIAKEQHLNLEAVLDEEFIFIGLNLKHQNEVIEMLSESYIEKKLAKSNFKKAIYQREALGTTGLSTGVAIPHADPSSVLKTKISIVILKNPIIWGKTNVSVIILLAIAEKDISSAKSLIASIYELLSSEKQIRKLASTTNKSEIISFFSERS